MNRAGRRGVIPGMGTLPTRDEELVRLLYAQHAGALLGYVQRLLGGDRQRAEDVVQETLLRAWRHPEAFASTGAEESANTEGRARAWLYTVARNIVVDSYRARQARPSEVSAQALDGTSAPDELDRALEAWQVSDALRTLSPLHREVLVEVFFAHRSVNEAAAILGVPAGTVKSRTFYALRALRLALQERGVTSL